MEIVREKFLAFIDDRFEGNCSRAARALLVTPQYISKYVKQQNAKAGADLLGGLASYCLSHGLNFWDFIILPKR